MTDTSRGISEQKNYYQNLPQEIVPQYFYVSSLTIWLTKLHQYIVVCVCQLYKPALNLKAQRKSFVFTIATLDEAIWAIL